MPGPGAAVSLAGGKAPGWQRKRGARATSSAASGKGTHRALLWKEAGSVGSRATARRGPEAAVGRSAGLRPAAIFAGWAPASHSCGCGSRGVLGRGSAAFVSVPQGEAEQQRKKNRLSSQLGAARRGQRNCFAGISLLRKWIS